MFSKAMLDEDDGFLVYELTFLADGQEYEYEISASTGDVIKYEQEPSGQSCTHSNVSSKKLIEKERAEADCALPRGNSGRKYFPV